MPIATRFPVSISRVLPIVLFGTCALPLGCVNVEWNWDLYRWEKPRRVVRPARGAPAPDAGRAEAQPADEKHVDAHSSADAAAPESKPPQIPIAARPFYHLYLLTTERVDRTSRGEAHVTLKNVDALSCARALEPLYVPLGRSGTPEESYLIYEEKEEFERALQFAPELDVGPHATPGDADARPFAVAVAAFLNLMKQDGAVVSAASVAESEDLLSAAGKDERNAPLQRWAASILAARVAAEHRFDYAAALRHLAVARSQAAPDSVERMTAEWWHADGLTQHGKTDEANDAYAELLDTYETRWPNAHVIGRARALLKERRTR